MNTSSVKSERFVHLLGDLQSDIKVFIQKELELAKTELNEKFKTAGRSAGMMIAGGILGLFALMLLLHSLAALLAQLYERADLSPGTAYFLSYLTLAVILGGAGFLLLRKGQGDLSDCSLSPEKALATVKGEEVPIQVKIVEPKAAQVPKPDSNQLKEEAEAVRTSLGAEMEELKSRMKPGYMVRSCFAGMKHHPVRTLLLGVGTGLGGYLYYRQRHLATLQRAAMRKNWWPFKMKMRHA